MLNFKQFLSENIYLTEEIKSSDDKGKLHELLVAKHLSSENSEEKSLPTRYTDKTTQKTPQQTHDDIKSRISPEDYSEANKRAKDAAHAIKLHIEKTHGVKPEHIKEVVWTSNKSDHKSLTGEADANSDADIMIKHQHPDSSHPSYHGLSLKVGSGKPNLRNPGLATLDKLTGAKSTHTSKILDEHKKNLDQLGYHSEDSQKSNHIQYKADKAKEEGTPERIKADNADVSKLHTLGKLAEHYANGINNSHPDKVKHLLTTLIAPKTKYPHIRIHTKTPKPGTSGETIHHVDNHIEDTENELAKHEHGFHAVSKGQTFHIHAKNKDGSVGKRLASIGLKGVSGPIRGIAGATASHIGNHNPLNESEELEENKLANVMDTCRHYFGPMSTDKFSASDKERAAKHVSKEHKIPLEHAKQFVKDYCVNKY